LGSPGFGALYLNASLDVARANARRHAQESFGVSIDDLVDERLPDLQHYEVVSADFVDAVTPSRSLRSAFPSHIRQQLRGPPVRKSPRSHTRKANME